jgi:hypothetical protein
VCCAFSFCWQALLAEHPGQPAPPDPQAATVAARGAEATGHRRRIRLQRLVAGGGAGVADPLERVGALLAVVVTRTATPAAATAA